MLGSFQDPRDSPRGRKGTLGLYSINQNDVQPAVQLIPQWLAVNRKSKIPVAAQSVGLGVSAGLQYK